MASPLMSVSTSTPPKMPRLLRSPGAAPQPIQVGTIALQAVAIAMFSFVVTVMLRPILSSLSLVAGVAIFIILINKLVRRTQSEIESFPKRLRSYERSQEIYLKEKELYEKQQELYESELKHSAKQKSSEQEAQEYSESVKKQEEIRRDRLRQVLRQAVSPDCTNNPKRGRAEAEFETYLRQYFPGFICTGPAFQIPDYEYPYTPDFIYVDPELNLWIDIEIDEPYAYDTKKPIHYIDSRDEDRNDFFIQRGWVVIRFSEEQVVRYPDRCCKTIARAIADILGDDSILNSFNYVSDLKPATRWTSEQGLEMAHNNYRDSYLK